MVYRLRAGLWGANMGEVIAEGPVCSHCMRPIVGRPLRHYGTHVAHAEYECLQILHAEIERLRDWIRDEGSRTGVCTIGVLGVRCDNCMCASNPRSLAARLEA